MRTGFAVRRLAVLASVVVLGLASSGGAAQAVLAAAPTTADGFFQTFQDLNNERAYSGGDQVTSLRAPNGLTYWSFGDTVLGREDPATGGYQSGWTMIANKILVQRGGTFTSATAAGAVAVPAPSADERYWTQGMFTSGGKLYVLCQRVANVDGGFELRGVEIAQFGFNPGGTLTLEGMLTTPSTGKIGGSTVETAQYSMDAVVSAGYVYVFGFRNAPEDTSFQPHRSYVARVATDSIASSAAWQFYADGTWSDSMADATSILSAQISSVRLIGDQWYLAYKPWNGWGDTVFVERRSEPWAAPSGTVTVSSPGGTTAGGQQYTTYSPQLHPEQSLASGKMLLSIAWNGATLADLAADADLYKPRFSELTLP
jgi:hypothetical protein